MAEDVALELAKQGHEVIALATTGVYDGASGQAQHFDGSSESGPVRVESVKVPAWMPRALAWAWFTWQARKRIPQLAWDVCVLMTDPPLLPLLAGKVSPKPAEERRTSAIGAQRGETAASQTPDWCPKLAAPRVAVWLMDLYPEALAAAGKIGWRNPMYRWYFSRRQRALAACDSIIFLGQAQKERVVHGEAEGGLLVAGRGNSGRPGNGGIQTQSGHMAVVPPWDDRADLAVATEFSLTNLALYAGNLGEAHCFEEILAAAPHLPSDWTIRFAVRGAKYGALTAKARDAGERTQRDRQAHQSTHLHGNHEPAQDLNGPNQNVPSRQLNAEGSRGARVEVTGYATEAETPKLMASARVHVITMSPGWEGIVVPSKLYGCVRTGRPVLFIGPENADTAREVLLHDWGAVLPSHASGQKVAAAILELAARPTRMVHLQSGATQVARFLTDT